MADGDKPIPEGKRLKQALERAGLLNEKLRKNTKTAAQTFALAQGSGLQRIMGNILPKPPALSNAVRAIQEWQKTKVEIGDGLNRLISNIQTIDFKRMFSAFDWMVEEGRKAKLVEQSGWLPHDTTPFHLLEGEPTEQELSEIIAKHYEDEWETVEQTFVDRLTEYTVDDEAKATLQEGLKAHRHGLFRVAPRLLFPEIERVAADEFYGGSHKTEIITAKGKTKQNPITRLEEVRESALELPLGDLATYEYSWHLFKKMEDHLYEEVGEDQAVVAKFRADAVPNRHAALHGLICYKTQQTSLNAIIMADFMFHLITQIKRYRSEEVAAE